MGRAALAATMLCLGLAACGDDEGETATAPGPAASEEAIAVSQPGDGDAVSSPVTVAGSATVFEGTVAIRVLDSSGKAVAQTFATASAGAPERGEFSEDVRFRIDSEQDGTIEVSEPSVASGDEAAQAERSLVEIPVTLRP